MRAYSVILAVLLVNISFAQEFIGEEFKIELNIPEGYTWDTYIDRDWGCLETVESETKTNFNVYAYLGEAKKKDLYAYGIERTKIPKKLWEPIKIEENVGGFEWKEFFQIEYNGKTLFAVISKSAFHPISYLYYVSIPTEIIENEESIIGLVENVKGIE